MVQQGSGTTKRIFISYRRSDCLAQANGLRDGLGRRLPGARVFKDIDSIPPGEDFEEYIRSEIEACDVVLVLIGDNWLDPRPGTATRRLDEANDFVRLEVESALRTPGLRVIPVLVEGAKMPEPSELPESIRRLARLNAFDLDDRRWEGDLERLTQALRGPLDASSAGAQHQPTTRSAPWSATGEPIPAYTTPAPRAAPASPPFQVSSGLLRKVWTPWIILAPLLSLGFLSFLPFLKAARLRPMERRTFVKAGIATEAVALAGFVCFAVAPTSANGDSSGPLANTGGTLLLIAIAVGCTVGVVFRHPLRANVNQDSAKRLAKAAGIPLSEAQQVVSQRALVGWFDSVEHAIAAAELSPQSATRLRQIAVA